MAKTTRASLIEIEQGLPEVCWYARYGGLRLWVERTTAYIHGSPAWRVLPEQGIPWLVEAAGWLIEAEHAWEVRESEVEWILREVTPESRQVEARL